MGSQRPWGADSLSAASTYGPPHPDAQPVYPQAAYPGTPWGFPVSLQPVYHNGAGAAALPLGILSLLGPGPLLGIPAIILGVIGQRRADQGRANNVRVARVGMICGILGTIWVGLVAIGILTKAF